MRESRADVLIVGGGTGGAAAALSALSLGVRVVLTEETDWIGGQLSAQLVPPDEHPWIETFGRTRRYAGLRDAIRAEYGKGGHSDFNPGGGWVSRLCFAPELAHRILLGALERYVAEGRLEILFGQTPFEADCSGDEVRSLRFLDRATGDLRIVHAAFVLDATETGELYPLTLAEYRLGSDAAKEFGEPSAPDEADEHDVQSFTHVFAITKSERPTEPIAKPKTYAKWRAYRPAHWPGPLLGATDLDPVSNLPRDIPWDRWFTYRQIVDPAVSPGALPASAVNWPMNDYMEGRVVDVADDVRDKRLAEAKELSLSLLHFLQTEAGVEGLALAPELSGTPDGFAKTVYHREGRRLRTRRTITENDVRAVEGRDRGTEYEKSVGVGAYRIDLHPSASGKPYLDLSTLPFHIPLGALVPERLENLLPAGKGFGVTHVANGCTRLHPVEWNVGEVAGLLAAFCHVTKTLPADVHEDVDLWADFARLLDRQGVEREWPRLRAL